MVRRKRCPGCGEELILHPKGKGSKHCEGIDPPSERVKDPPPPHGQEKDNVKDSPEETEPPSHGSATAELEKKKEALLEQLAKVKLESEVAALEDELKQAQAAMAARATITGKPLQGQQDKMVLGEGDITLQQLRENAVLQHAVDTKYALPGAGKKRKDEGKPLSPEAFVYNLDSSEPKKYDELSLGEFMSGCMALLRSENLPRSELLGRLSVLQYCFDRLARYKWAHVRTFHAAAVSEAMSVPGVWSDWAHLKEMFFDGNKDNLKPADSGDGGTSTQTAPRICWSFNKNSCFLSTCRFDHCCRFCWESKSMKYKHAEADCERKRRETKQTRVQTADSTA
ncbi:uncharacterized protein [Branchiostoma lanceolatum]|uniref:uncharacterized protein n=1 Tax=Branchiostoma lanceolatum TaxID=7740 RepID=UPI003453083C